MPEHAIQWQCQNLNGNPPDVIAQVLAAALPGSRAIPSLQGLLDAMAFRLWGMFVAVSET